MVWAMTWETDEDSKTTHCEFVEFIRYFVEGKEGAWWVVCALYREPMVSEFVAELKSRKSPRSRCLTCLWWCGQGGGVRAWRVVPLGRGEVGLVRGVTITLSRLQGM